MLCVCVCVRVCTCVCACVPVCLCLTRTYLKLLCCSNDSLKVLHQTTHVVFGSLGVTAQHTCITHTHTRTHTHTHVAHCIQYPTQYRPLDINDKYRQPLTPSHTLSIGLNKPAACQCMGAGGTYRPHASLALMAVPSRTVRA